MPKTKFEDVIFTIIMVFVMVYAMICYNIVLNTGAMTYSVFLSSFHDLVIIASFTFSIYFFFSGHIPKKTAFRLVNPEKENPFHLVLAISAVSVMWMCPLMSFVATLLFKNAGTDLLPVWLQTVALNFPMAFFWQICYAGPFVRFVFRLIFRQTEGNPETSAADECA